MSMSEKRSQKFNEMQKVIVPDYIINQTWIRVNCFDIKPDPNQEFSSHRVTSLQSLPSLQPAVRLCMCVCGV